MDKALLMELQLRESIRKAYEFGYTTTDIYRTVSDVNKKLKRERKEEEHDRDHIEG